MIENFRPGTLERWGLGYDVLSARNPRLVLARVTGFGQKGPYRSRPGFGTLAEAMSGFAAMTGEPDGPPVLPPFGLADGIASLATAYAIMVALHAASGSGAGQEVDVAIIEPMLAMLGPQITRWDQLGTVQARTGNRSANNAPRNTYRTADGSWVAVSTSAQSIAERVMALVGRPDLIAEPWFATGAGRAEHADELDDAVGGWIVQRSRDEVIDAFDRAQAAVAPVYDAPTSWPTRSSRRWAPSTRSSTRISARCGCRARCSGCRRTRPSSRSPAARSAPTRMPCSASSGTRRARSPRLRAEGSIA